MKLIQYQLCQLSSQCMLFGCLSGMMQTATSTSRVLTHPGHLALLLNVADDTWQGQVVARLLVLEACLHGACNEAPNSLHASKVSSRRAHAQVHEQ